MKQDKLWHRLRQAQADSEIRGQAKTNGSQLGYSIAFGKLRRQKKLGFEKN